MLACIGTEWKPLTWVRYSIWIPLYPLGVLAEGTFSLPWKRGLKFPPVAVDGLPVLASSGGRDPVPARL